MADSESILTEIFESLVNIEGEALYSSVKKALNAGIDPVKIIDSGIVRGLSVIGEKFATGEYFLVELVGAAEPAQEAVRDLLEPELKKKAGKTRGKGKIVIGTVKGDVHSIGKNIVATLLFASGFEVINLGEDVAIMDYINKAKEVGADLIAASSLLTTTLPGQEEIVKALEAEGMRPRVKTLFGGSPCTPEWVEKIGGDGYAENALEAVKVASTLIGVSE
jgi:trimethylamine corrinoid protein